MSFESIRASITCVMHAKQVAERERGGGREIVRRW